VKYREVGATGVRVSEIGFGGGGNAGLMVRGTAKEQQSAIGRALDLGINYFDQAPDYGDGISETNLGHALKTFGAHPIITTKVEVRSQDLDDIAGHIERSVDASLHRLQIDCVDFLQIHNGPLMTRPALSGRSYRHLSLEDYLRPGGGLDGLQRVQHAGKARFIGIVTRGNDGAAARQLIDTGCLSLINVSINLLNPSASIRPQGMRVGQDFDEILGYAAAHRVGTAIYSPLAGGLLTDQAVGGGAPHPLARELAGPDARGAGLQQARAFRFLSRELDPAAQTDDHNLTEAAIRFVLSREGVTVVLGGFSDARQVEQAADCAAKGPLSNVNMTRIEDVWRANFLLEL